MLIDTDVLIDYLRGRTEAVEFLEANVEEEAISSVTVAELYQGVREGSERLKLATMLSALKVLPLTEEIAEGVGLLRREHRNSAGCGLADCMIAATATHHGLKIVTLNEKHFGMLDGVIVPYHKV